LINKLLEGQSPDNRVIIFAMIVIAIVSITKIVTSFLILLLKGSEAHRQYRWRAECHNEDNLTGRCLGSPTGCQTVAECTDRVSLGYQVKES
jgi:hypothetical protein